MDKNEESAISKKQRLYELRKKKLATGFKKDDLELNAKQQNFVENELKELSKQMQIQTPEMTKMRAAK